MNPPEIKGTGEFWSGIFRGLSFFKILGGGYPAGMLRGDHVLFVPEVIT